MGLQERTKAYHKAPSIGIAAFEIIKEELAEICTVITQRLSGGSDAVSQLVKDLPICSGKMIRPGLVLLSHHAICDTNSGNSHKKAKDTAVLVGAIVEIIHTATLLHDDVIDDGQIRRGVPTINSVSGNEAAVLLGDFLLCKVFEMCAGLDREMTKVIASTTSRICDGELRQLASRKKGHELSEAEYIDIITEKSAALFSGCCHLGALSAGASETAATALAEFGLNVGIAFQIADDVLDIVGQEDTTGKTLGSDIDNEKMTLAFIHLLRSSGKGNRDAIAEDYSRIRKNKKELLEMLNRFGSLEYAGNRANEFVAKGIDALSCIEDSDAKKALAATAKFASNRSV